MSHHYVLCSYCNEPEFGSLRILDHNNINNMEFNLASNNVKITLSSLK